MSNVSFYVPPTSRTATDVFVRCFFEGNIRTVTGCSRGKYTHQHKGRKPKRGNPWK